jgi:hypothetical protein
MNKRSVQKRPAKASRNQVARKAAARRIPGKSEAAKRISAAKLAKPSKPARTPATPSAAIPAAAISAAAIATTAIPAAVMPAAATVPPAKAITMPGPALRTHRFRVGETVLYTSSPITRPGASGTYKVVKLLPSDGDDYQYRIKNSDEAFERVAKESQLETEPS